MRLSAGVLLLSLACGPLQAQATDAVTIYRCTDASGRLTLRDTPCAKDQKQQTRSMLRPKDAPVERTPAPPRVGATPAATPPPRVVMVSPPRPLYECIPPGGEPYVSDSAEGNPRWVPLWTLDYPIAGYPFGGSRTDLAITHGNVRLRGGRSVLIPPLYGAAAYGAGTWVRDDCHALPQADVCARLVDRRDVIRRRFFNAMPSERDVLRVEERGINARLDNDCGGY
jgi:hypothetical protein